MTATGEFRYIPLEQIMAGQDLQMRVHLDAQTIADYVEWLAQLRLQSNGLKDMPPIVVFSTGQKVRMTPVGSLVEWFWLADGFHRLEAWLSLRTKAFVEGSETFPTEIPARVLRGDQRDAILYAAGANAEHGLRRNAADLRRAVETLMKDTEWGQWSDREIARRCHVSPTFVGKVRGDLTVHADSEELTRRTYTTKHGTVATMDTAKIGKPDPGGDRVSRQQWLDQQHQDYLDQSKAEAETFTPPPANSEILAANTDVVTAHAPEISIGGQEELSGDSPPISGDSPPTLTMRDVVDQWLARQGDVGTQRERAQQLARFGIHADCWPELKLAFPLGVAYVPDELRRLGAEALARLDAPPPSITLQLERRQAEVLYVAIQRHMVPSRERNELIELLGAALGPTHD